MKTKVQILILSAILLQLNALSQTSGLGNFSTDPTDYLGWNLTTTHDLNIRHFRSDQSILFYTNNTERMRIHRDGQLSLGTQSILGNAKLTVLQKEGINGISGISENQSSPIFSPNFDCRLSGGNSNHTSAFNFGITATSSSSV